MPFRDSSFALVTMNMVVEHLANPTEQFREVFRVLAPGGLLVLHTPNARGYATLLSRFFPDRVKSFLAHLLEGRPEDDVFPTFFRANTPEAIRAAADGAGLTVKELELVCTDAVLAYVPPLFLPELLFIRLLQIRPFARYRSNILAVLKRP